MAKLTIDDQEYDVADGNNLLHACLSIGLDLPYFCWHPCMGSVGACRQCAVKQYQDENDERGRVVMACMTPASDGTRISIEDKQAKDFRAGVIELLMTNHPHDCPVCEEGGECHLQDMTEMSGHNTRIYEGAKRTHRNQYLGPFINHEMNRCISCYRCVRYYQDYAGGHDLDAMGAHHHVYFGRHSDGVLESPFAGNLVEVCPTGVFTDKTFSEHYSRKWDLQTSPSICQHCAVGCNITPGERYGTLKRITNRYNSEVNSYFLCDRGRFGYGFVNRSERITQTLTRQKNDDGNKTDTAIQCSSEEGIARLSRALKAQDTIAIGSPRASLESNFALQTAVGKNNFYRGIASSEDQVLEKILSFNQMVGVNPASLQTMETCDAVLIIGEDLTHTAPRTALSLRQTVRQKSRELAEEARIPFWQDAAVRELSQHKKSPLFILNPTHTDLDDIAAGTLFNSPDKIARFGFALAEKIEEKLADSTAGGVVGKFVGKIAEKFTGEKDDLTGSLSPEEMTLCETIAATLSKAKRPLIISGVSLHSTSVVESACAVIQALHKKHNKIIDAHFVVPEANTNGLALLTGNSESQALKNALNRIETGTAKRVVVLENDLYRRVCAEKLDPLLEKIEELIVIDQYWNKSISKADLILPAASFAESDGTLVSSEGRAQRFFATFPVDADKSSACDSWQWINRALSMRWRNFDHLVSECAGSCAELAPIAELAPNAAFRQHGSKVPRMPHRYSGRTAMLANKNVSEPKQKTDDQTALGFTMEGSNVQAPPSLQNTAWAPGWNSNQSVHKFQDEVGGTLPGGSSGKRLFGLAKVQAPSLSPPPLQGSKSGFTSIPLYHIFGSDELSNFSPPIEERIPHPYIALNPEDAEQHNLRQGDGAIITFEGELQRFCLEIIVKSELIPGYIGLPMGMGGLHAGLLNHSISLEKDSTWKRRARSGDANVIATDQTKAQDMGVAP